MRNRVIVAGTLLLVVFAGCSSDAPAETTTSPLAAPPTTRALREGLVPDVAAVRSALTEGRIGTVEADGLFVAAMWGDSQALPIEYLATPEDIAPPQWDHTALSRHLENWDSLDVVSRSRLLTWAPPLGELVGLGPEPACAPVDRSVDVVLCSSELSARLGSVASSARPVVQQAVTDAWFAFGELLAAPAQIRVFLADLELSGTYAWGTDAEGNQVCHVYVDVADDEGDLIVSDAVRSAVVHQLFHCFQQSGGGRFDAVLWEGTAAWAEHHIDPSTEREVGALGSWSASPDAPFGERLEDAAFAFFYSANRLGAAAIAEALSTGSVAGLVQDEAEFARLWHDIAVATWSLAPRETEGALPTGFDVSLERVSPEQEGSFALELPPFSTGHQILEFDGPIASGADRVAFARLALDVSSHSSDVMVSVLVETPSGWVDTLDLTGVGEEVFCRSAVGACNDADPVEIAPFTRLVLVATNVDNGTESFQVAWNTFNPRLDGTWVRVDGPLFTDPGETAPYSIIGTELAFAENDFLMGENTAFYMIANSEPGWGCNFAGGYTVGADPAYGSPGAGDVDGTVTIDPTVGDGGEFTNECLFSSKDGEVAETRVPGIHIPLADDGAFGFEIRDYDTLWIYGNERIYVYERVVTSE